MRDPEGSGGGGSVRVLLSAYARAWRFACARAQEGLCSDGGVAGGRGSCRAGERCLDYGFNPKDDSVRACAP
eukprot:6211129-Pleurochrysis_carterae.AAC.2